MKREIFVLYHVCHMAKHFVNGGCGIRPFVDLRIIERKLSYSQREVDQLLKESGLKSFYDAVKALIGVWFDGDNHTELTKRMQEFLLTGGVYGSVEQCSAVRQVKSGGKLRYLLKKAFVGYRELCVCFPSLKKCPVLFPFYEVARWFKMLFGKDRKRVLATLKANDSVSTEQKSGVEKLISELDLL